MTHAKVLHHPSGATMVIHGNGESRLGPDIPRSGDCTVEHLLEVLEGLPERFCLFFDGRAGRFHVLQSEDALGADRGDGLVIKRAAGQAVLDQKLDTVLQAQHADG